MELPNTIRSHPDFEEIVRFLNRVKEDSGENGRVHTACVRVLDGLPLGESFNAFYTLTTAKLELQHSQLDALAKMNKQPFGPSPY